MKHPTIQPLRRRRAFSLIEALVASSIVALSLMAMVSGWYLSFNMTTATNDQGVAYNLARQTLEQIKGTGFYNTSEASVASPVVHYFDGAQVNKDSTPSTARYKVTTSVVSSATVASSNPVAPTDLALRTVTVTVTLVSNSSTLCQTSTYLTRGGV